MKIVKVIILSVVLYSCSDTGKSNKEQDLLKEMKEDSKPVSVSREVLDGMMQTLPSPIEIANIITKSKGDFNKALLIPSNNAETYTDKYTQALALGGYGVDLGYLNLNDKTLYVLEYLESIRTVAKGMKVEAYFDFSLLSDLAKNRKNVDSLIHISTQNFNAIDEYLRSQNRGDLSVLILIGSWIEGLHMFVNIAKDKPGDDIHRRIGEQKIIIDNVYAILNKIEDIPYYKELKIKLNGLKTVYAKVKIAYVYH
ncbi:MAG: hypothetical protein ACXVO9_11970, partial [Bacteroidia bacterium]